MALRPCTTPPGDAEIGCRIQPPPVCRRAGEPDGREPEIGAALAERDDRSAGFKVAGDRFLQRDHPLGRRAAGNPQDVVRPQGLAKRLGRANDVEGLAAARTLEAADVIIGAGGRCDDALARPGGGLPAAVALRSGKWQIVTRSAGGVGPRIEARATICPVDDPP
ncbi:hypothetical protein [Chelativorans xinjiangense]|uniref:hypothetical protein n=1 Tax=Chelativorans xinjiangense TaxID=2681485 RepID=UPI001915F69F|nr:hypothetical protein [Chelativorans xinjiangense]